VDISTKPRTHQVVEQVYRFIKENELAKGDHLPSEAEMAKKLNVSRNTVREAYIHMAREGIILRKHGIGTIVARSKLVDTMYSVRRSYLSMIRDAGLTPRIEQMTHQYVAAPPEVLEVFALEEETELLCVSRVIMAGEVPGVYVIDYFAPGIRNESLDWSRFEGDMVDFIARSFQEKDWQYHSRIQAADATSEVASLLDIPEGRPVVVTKSTVHPTGKLNTMVYTVNFMNPSIVELDVTGTLEINTVNGVE
jgi:GntR family transcriptional regulator